jgi:hypothetical protein
MSMNILAAVKLTTDQVIKLPLWHKIRKIYMIYFARPGLTEDLYVAQEEKMSIACYTCDTGT